MRSLFLFCIASTVWGAELVLPAPPYLYNDGVNTELGHGYASVCVLTPTGVNTNIGWFFDTDAHWQSAHTLRYRTGISAGSGTGTLCMPIKGLAANTLYRVCPAMADGSGNSTNCTNTGSDAKRFFTFTTLPAPAVDPVPPTRANVSDFDTGYPANAPAIGGLRDFPVASDCHDLPAQIAAAVAAANSAGLTAAVTIPSRAVCSGGNLPSLPARTAGQPWVIVRTSQETALPPPGIRVRKSEYGQYMPVMKVTSANSSFINGDATTNAKIRFVGIRIIFDDGTAFPGAGNPTYTAAILWRVTVAASWIIFDRCIFDGQGYPSRLFAAVFWSGQASIDHIAWVGCHFADIYNWLPWMGQMTLTGSGTPTLNSSAPFQLGRGDSVVTIPPWAIHWNGGDTSGVMYVMPGGSLHFKYALDTTPPTCTGALAGNCTFDAGLTVPPTGLQFNAVPMTITGGNWNTPAPTIYYFYGNAGTGLGLVPPGERESFALYGEANNQDIVTQKIIFQNNNVDGAGILFFMETDGVVRDIVVDRNDFSATPGCFMPNPPDASHPFSCHTRYPFEIKNGYNLDLTGNTIHDWYAAQSEDGSWFALKPDLTTRPGSYVGDAYIANNYVTEVAGCFYISGEINNGNGIWLYPKPIRRVEFRNNFCRSDAYRYTSYWGKYGAGVPHFGFSVISQGGVDFGLYHNTFFDNRGRGPGLFVAETFAHGIAVTDNILTYHQSSGAFKGFVSGFYGTGRWSASTIPDIGFSTLLEGTAALNAAIPSLGNVAGISWQWDNVMIPGCVDSAPANCRDTTSGSALLSAPTSQYPSTTRWPSGSTLAGRYQTTGFVNRSGGDFRLSYNSPFQSGGASHASDGLAYGINQDVNEQARGTITQVRVVSITSTSAVISATVPNPGGACSVAYSLTGGPPWTITAADTSGSRQRSIGLAGLSPITTYSYQVWCPGGPPTATRIFRTRTQ